MRRSLVLVLACGCGPVVGDADDGGTGGDTHVSSASEPASITANTTLPPQTEVSSLEGTITLDGISFEDGLPYDFGASTVADTGSSCPQIFDVYPAASVVAVLVDASQTMVTQLVDHDGDAMTPEITRWAMVHEALVEHMQDLVYRSLVGEWSFPASTAEAPPATGACTMDGSHPGLGSGVDQILQYLPPAEATFMQGATPTAAALAGAYSEIEALASYGRGHLLVITDGAPNCDAALAAPELFDQVDSHAYEWAAYAYGDDKDVHVIGIDVPTGTAGGGPEGDAITDHRMALSQLAQAGGTAAIFADDATVLDLALAAFVDEVASCRIVVPGPLVGFYYHVIIGGARYYYELPPELCPDNAGFVRTTLDGIEVIELCGAACDSLLLHGVATLEQECVFPE